MRDPFDLLDLEPRFDLDPKVLERRHLALARSLHPDHQASPEDAARVLAQSAEVNDAYRLLKDPWKRARALIERFAGETLQRQAQPDPAFLLEVMEIRERIEDLATKDRDSARRELEARLDDFRNQLLEVLAPPGGPADLEQAAFDRAARLLHDAGYFRQALRRLDGDLD